MEEATIPTWNILRSLGFQPDSKVISDCEPGLSFDFGNLKLSASWVVSPRGVAEVVFFTGILSTPRAMAEIGFELPRRMKSTKQCAAWIVWNLDRYCDGALKQTCHTDWVEEGRQNESLLPWVRSIGEYELRPQCVVRRDWLRLALKTLGQNISLLPDQAIVVFSFDGSVLSIRCDNKVIALAGEGLPWAVHFKVAAEKLGRLTKRLRHERIEVSIWQSSIRLGTWIYQGTLEQFGTTDLPSVQ